jgi:hypothetical protein
LKTSRNFQTCFVEKSSGENLSRCCVLRVAAAGEKLQIRAVGRAVPTEAVFAISNAQSMMPAYSRLVARKVDYQGKRAGSRRAKSFDLLANAG